MCTEGLIRLLHSTELHLEITHPRLLAQELTLALLQSKADKPKEAEAPWPPSLLIRGCMYDTGERWRSACISLDGLLDYDEEDKEEGAFEINLFAENFSELLARDYGRTILTSLYAARYQQFSTPKFA